MVYRERVTPHVEALAAIIRLPNGRRVMFGTEEVRDISVDVEYEYSYFTPARADITLTAHLRSYFLQTAVDPVAQGYERAQSGIYLPSTIYPALSDTLSPNLLTEAPGQ